MVALFRALAFMGVKQNWILCAHSMLLSETQVSGSVLRARASKLNKRVLVSKTSQASANLADKNQECCGLN